MASRSLSTKPRPFISLSLSRLLMWPFPIFLVIVSSAFLFTFVTFVCFNQHLLFHALQ